MIIRDDWTFVHIPRTGGVSLKMAYLTQFNFEQGRDYVVSPYERQDALRPLSVPEEMLNFGSEHALVNYWESLIPENSELFTIVRNPYDRFQSICRRGHDIALTDEDRANALNVDYVLGHEGWGCWSAATPQKEYLDSTSKSITVYKFETELQNAYEDHGLTFSSQQTGDIQNNASQNQTDILTPENIEKINSHFHDDFVEFGYSKR